MYYIRIRGKSLNEERILSSLLVDIMDGILNVHEVKKWM